MIDAEAKRKLRETISALRAKTTGNGCTEAEALASAAKVAELLTKHGLDDGALEFDEISLPIGRRTVVDTMWGQVATFCCCRHWLSGDGRTWDVVYFGRWRDVALAEYLHELLGRHIAVATRLFQKTPEYRRRRSKHTKRQATKAFQEGLVIGLRAKLWDLQWRRQQQTTGNAEHRALILSPLVAVDAEVERRKIEFSARPLAPVKAAGRKFDEQRESGARAASGIHINAPVAGQASAPVGLLTCGGAS